MVEAYNVPPLPGPEYRYLGPEPGYANGCECSSVKYSLLSACALCQSSTTALKYVRLRHTELTQTSLTIVIRWSTFSENCSRVYTGVYVASACAP
jgi:hypothetical protein